MQDSYILQGVFDTPGRQETRSRGHAKWKVPRLGSLCAGYAGLDMAVSNVFGAQLAWCADNDRHVAKVLSARFPHVPNLGDLTELYWRQLPPVDILCAGFPCQDISYAGLGAGIKH